MPKKLNKNTGFAIVSYSSAIDILEKIDTIRCGAVYGERRKPSPLQETVIVIREEEVVCSLWNVFSNIEP